MRINSDYKDYYDHLQSYTYGNSKTYNRNWSKMEYISDSYSNLYYNFKSISPMPKIKENGQKIEEEQIIIGFCGTIYSYMKKEKWTVFPWNNRTNSSPPDELNLSKIIYSIDEYVDINKKSIHNEREVRRVFGQFFFQKKEDDLFIKNNCPIFVMTDSKRICCSLSNNKKRVVTNTTLKELGFDLVVPDTTAWTDLTSYVDFLGTQFKEIPEMDNNTKIINHGFSLKDSFRK